MNSERLQMIREVFAQALERAPGDRAVFLETACAGDESLRREVEQFLEAHDATAALVDQPAAALLRSSAGDRPAARLEGRCVGSYTIVREIGHGGMGNVYLAERSIGRTRQSVALKVMLPGMAGAPATIRRFEQEREILASFDHPNIARLIDVGSTEEGLPYFVMEYVDGEAIDLYCDRQKLNIAGRLELFRAVCSALEYAHERGVVHRDLKPANILVKPDGTVKLLDFGIASALNNDGKETLTRTALRPMTLQYASPEQVKGESVSVRSDVYSLGIVLYELLTGHHPYRMESRMAHELARIICEEPPVWPSAAVTQTETRTTSSGVITITPEGVSESRAERPSRLRRILAGDLDSILVKALHKEPDWRYASAGDFSQDVHRHLTGLPVAAHKGNWKYRFQKAVGRVVYPAKGVIHGNAPMFISWGIFGAIIFARKQAVAVGFRHSYSAWDMLGVFIGSIVWSIGEGRRIKAKGYASPMDRMATLVLMVTVCILWILSVLGATTGTVPESAMSLFWTAGLAMALLIIGLQASRVLTAGGLVLLGSMLPAALHPRWFYGWLAAGMLVGIAGAGVIFAFQAGRRKE